MRPISAPQPCTGCGSEVRAVVDLNTKGDLLIDAMQAAGDVGNVVVQQVEPSTGLWLIEVFNRPGPPEPAERWNTYVPPSLWSIHVCPSVPASWPHREAAVQEEVVTS